MIPDASPLFDNAAIKKAMQTVSRIIKIMPKLSPGIGLAVLMNSNFEALITKEVKKTTELEHSMRRIMYKVFMIIASWYSYY
jgi:trans-aconitate methyltransferase